MKLWLWLASIGGWGWGEEFGVSCVSFIGRTLSLGWQPSYEKENSDVKTRVRKAFYPFLTTFQREENSNIKLGTGEILTLVGNGVSMRWYFDKNTGGSAT